MNGTQITWISVDDPPQAFPAVDDATEEPDGLLAAGGDLSSERLLYAYGKGIFPWYDEGQPILWWSPNPRCVLLPGEFRLARRLRRTLKSCSLELTVNTAFRSVISACADDREGQLGTWITPDMTVAYTRLHAEGWAHSIEVWDGDELAGGLYGLAIGRAFFGESMFSRVTNASKLALMMLCRILQQESFPLIDCQISSPHLASLGARSIERAQFVRLLEEACQPPERADFWPKRRVPATELIDRSADALQ